MTTTQRLASIFSDVDSDFKKMKEKGHAYDPYLYSFVKTAQGILSNWDKEKYTENDIVLRGLSRVNQEALKECISEDRIFYYIDTGYLQPGNKKEYHRIVKNNLQNIGDIVDRPTDRLVKLNWRYQKPISGDYILIVPPSKKVMGVYNADYDIWMGETIDKIKTVTNLPIKVRHKPIRRERVNNNPLWKDLKNAKCLVTYNSIAASEAMFYSKPAVALAPNAATSLCNSSLDDIPKNLYVPTKEEITKFISHLSYCQFTQKEMDSGFAWKIVNEGG